MHFSPMADSVGYKSDMNKCPTELATGEKCSHSPPAQLKHRLLSFDPGFGIRLRHAAPQHLELVRILHMTYFVRCLLLWHVSDLN